MATEPPTKYTSFFLSPSPLSLFKTILGLFWPHFGVVLVLRWQIIFSFFFLFFLFFFDYVLIYIMNRGNVFIHLWVIVWYLISYTHRCNPNQPGKIIYQKSRKDSDSEGKTVEYHE